MTCIVTNLPASVVEITWMLLDYRLQRKWSSIGFSSGVILGLLLHQTLGSLVHPRPSCLVLWLARCIALLTSLSLTLDMMVFLM